MEQDYKHIIVFMIDWAGYQDVGLTENEQFEVSFWCLRDMMSFIESATEQKQKRCVDIIQAYFMDGLLLDVKREINDKTFFAEKTILDGKFQTYFAYGLGVCA